MEPWAVLAGVVCIAVGLVGIVVPVLPGLFLVWAGVLAWALLSPGGFPWVVVIVATLLYAAGIVTEVAIPGRRMKRAGVQWSTQAIGVVGAIICSFLIPVVGFFVGFPLAVFLYELARTKDAERARKLTVHAVKGMGLNILIELTTGFLIAVTFAMGVLA